ncbi:MAG: hypothetical protein ACOC1T_02165 [Halorhodospira sp.]
MIGDDWQVDFSTVHGAQEPGLTRVLFCNPDDPHHCCHEEFFLDGLRIEDLRWKTLPAWTYSDVREAEEEARQGVLRVNYELAKNIQRL